MKKHIWVICIIYALWIGFIIGDTVASVGQMPSCKPFPWYMPLAMLGFMGGIGIPAFIIGKEIGKKK
jgi:hypothetical protein